LHDVTVYRIFRRAGEAAPVKAIVIAMIAIACLATAIGVVRVARQHEVLRLGYELSRESDHARALREVRRRLELEHATLCAPDRIRRLATALGMTPVAPDRIRVIARRHEVAER
jgi:cell division protein FtsL